MDKSRLRARVLLALNQPDKKWDSANQVASAAITISEAFLVEDAEDAKKLLAKLPISYRSAGEQQTAEAVNLDLEKGRI